jgi:hypothetical protein
MIRTGVILTSLAAAMLALSADGSARAQQLQKSKPKPTAKDPSPRTLLFTLSTTQPNKPGKKMRARKK